MEYSFEPFVEATGGNWFKDDALLGRLLDHFIGAGGWNATEMTRWGATVSGRLKELAEASAASTALPRVEHFDPRGRRIDRIVLPESTLQALAEVEGRQRLGAVHGNPFEFYAKGYLCGQNGEAGVLCSVGCTDGLVRVLEAVGDRPDHARAVERIRASTPERVWHGAQFVTEVQGGSDVPANRTRAVPERDGWRLYGRKWFCSNVNADYFLVTGRPDGSEAVGLFLVPAYEEPGRSAPGDGARNGYTVDRLKDKLGTRELATAELTFDGAIGFAVGSPERGLSNLVRYVLTTSRFYCVQSAASTLRQAERMAGAYTCFREAFGRRLVDFPAAQERLDEIRLERRRALACYFELLRLWEAGREGEDDAELLFRVMLSLCKPVLTQRATRLTREAMILLGGNGIEERFSPLPRLLRDAVIMEIWEGPHDVLFSQALRDLKRFDVDPGDFVDRVTEGSSELSHELGAFLASENPLEEVVPFRRWAGRMVSNFGDAVLERLPAT